MDAMLAVRERIRVRRGHPQGQSRRVKAAASRPAPILDKAEGKLKACPEMWVQSGTSTTGNVHP